MKALRPLAWVGSALKDLRSMPEEVQAAFGYALHVAQMGERHESAKTLKGFGGAGVVELVEDLSGSTYRAVYTVKFEDVVYALHVFQKKSKRGAKTLKADIDLIRKRLKLAEEDYAERVKAKEKKP